MQLPVSIESTFPRHYMSHCYGQGAVHFYVIRGHYYRHHEDYSTHSTLASPQTAHISGDNIPTAEIIKYSRE